MTARAGSRRQRVSAEDSENGTSSGLLAALSDVVGNVVGDLQAAARERAERLSAAANLEADRLEGRLRRIALLSGACLGAGVLLVVGVSGALAELFGRAWVGQLGAAVAVLLFVVIWTVASRQRAKSAAEKAKEDDESVSGLLDEAGRSAPLLALAGLTGWLSGLFLVHRRGRRR